MREIIGNGDTMQVHYLWCIQQREIGSSKHHLYNFDYSTGGLATSAVGPPYHNSLCPVLENRHYGIHPQKGCQSKNLCREDGVDGTLCRRKPDPGFPEARRRTTARARIRREPKNRAGC